MSSNTISVPVSCKQCGQGTVLVQVTLERSNRTWSTSCSKCFKQSAYTFDVKDGRMTKIY